MPVSSFGRRVSGHLPASERREWLVTNGGGAYSCGTVAGLPMRGYHGLLMAALNPPPGRTMLGARLDETASYGGHNHTFLANRWADGNVEPDGFRDLKRLRPKGTVPVWTFACADALLEKRIWMWRDGALPPGHHQRHLRWCSSSRTARLHCRGIERGGGPEGFTACVAVIG